MCGSDGANEVVVNVEVGELGEAVEGVGGRRSATDVCEGMEAYAGGGLGKETETL